MTRFVIGPDVALHLARSQAVVAAQHQLLAPTLIRSQVLAQLYGLVRRGELDRKAAERQLDHRAAFGCACLATECCKASPGRSPTNSAGPIPSWPNTSP